MLTNARNIRGLQCPASGYEFSDRKVNSFSPNRQAIPEISAEFPEYRYICSSPVANLLIFGCTRVHPYFWVAIMYIVSFYMATKFRICTIV